MDTKEARMEKQNDVKTAWAHAVLREINEEAY